MSQTLTIYHIDAFTPRLHGGNPAAVMPLRGWLPDAQLLALAAENNLSETAFLVAAGNSEPGADFLLRWFTPAAEVDLCGHATLASAWVLFEHGGWATPQIRFATRSGILVAERASEGGIALDFPERPSQAAEPPAALLEGLGRPPALTRVGVNWIAIYDSQAEVAALRPDFRRLAELGEHGVIATAPGDEVDVVSRYFVPSYGIDEDPVTGSAHCDLAPYWCERLGREAFSARQISARGGELDVQRDAASGRVRLRGDCVLYMQGQVMPLGTAAG